MQRTYKILHIFILSCLASCSQLNIKIQNQILHCGQTADEKTKLLKVSNTSLFDARLVQGNLIKLLEPNPHGCIVLTSDNQDSELIVRSSDPTVGLLLKTSEVPAGLSFWELEKKSPLVRPAVSVQCPAKEILIHSQLPLAHSQSLSAHAQYSMLEIKYYNESRQLIASDVRKAEGLDALPVSLSDGQYFIELVNFDAFDEAKRPAGELCSVIIDKKVPELSLNLLSHQSNVNSYAYRVNPGQVIKFSINDQNPHKIMACLKKRIDENIAAQACTSDEFTEQSQGISIPENGMWDVSYYAEDKAGNRSALGYKAFAVFQKDIIEQIRLLDRQIVQHRDLAEHFKAFKTFQELVQTAKRLELREELQTVYWKLLGWTLDLARNGKLIWQVDLKDFGKRLQAVTSPSADHYLLLFEGARLMIVDGTKITLVPKGYRRVAYLSDKTFAAFSPRILGGGSSLDIYQGTDLIASVSAPSGYEYLSVDRVHKRLFIYGNNLNFVWMFSDWEKLTPPTKIALPQGFVSQYQVWRERDQFLSSPDGKSIFFYSQSSIVRFDTTTRKLQKYVTQDLCPVAGLAVKSTDELYFYSTKDADYANDKCGLRRLTWTSEGITEATLNPETQTQIDDMALSSSFLVASSSKNGFVWALDFRGETPTEKTFKRFGLDTEPLKLKMHPAMPDLVFVGQSVSITRLDLRNEAENQVTQLRVDNSTEILPLINGSEILSFHKNGRIERYWFDQSVPLLIPDGKPCGTTFCQTFPDQQLILGYLTPEKTLIAIDTNSWTEKRLNHDPEVELMSPCGTGHICFVDTNKSVFDWDMKSDETKELGQLPFMPGEMTFYSRVRALGFTGRSYGLYPSIFDGVRATFLGLDRAAWPDSRVVEGWPMRISNSPFLPVIRMTSDRGDEANNHYHMDLYYLDGTLARTIDLGRESKISSESLMTLKAVQRFWVSSDAASVYVITPTRLIEFDVATFAEKSSFEAPKGYELLGLKDDKTLKMVSRTNSARAETEKFYLFDLVKQETTEQPLLSYLPETVGQGHIWASYVEGPETIADIFGDLYDLDLDSIKAIKDDFHLAFTQSREGTIYVGEIRVTPEWIDAWLSKWPLAGIPLTEDLKKLPSL